MNKLLIGMVALVSAVGGVSACGSSEKSKVENKTQAAVISPDLAQKASVQPDVQPVAPVEPAARFTLVLNEGKSGFRFNSKILTEEAKAKIDEMFTGGAVELKDAHFEIEGYTDNLGSKDVNEQVGRARAEAVRDYIAEKYEVPLDCIKVTSFGSEKPVADNATPEGRAQNRRVVIKVVD